MTRAEAKARAEALGRQGRRQRQRPDRPCRRRPRCGVEGQGGRTPWHPDDRRRRLACPDRRAPRWPSRPEACFRCLRGLKRSTASARRPPAPSRPWASPGPRICCSICPMPASTAPPRQPARHRGLAHHRHGRGDRSAHNPPRRKGGPYRIVVRDPLLDWIQVVFFHARGDYLQRLLPTGQRRMVSGQGRALTGLPRWCIPTMSCARKRRASLPPYEPVYPLTGGGDAKPGCRRPRSRRWPARPTCRNGSTRR
jgi:hypothetical protein